MYLGSQVADSAEKTFNETFNDFFNNRVGSVWGAG